MEIKLNTSKKNKVYRCSLCDIECVLIAEEHPLMCPFEMYCQWEESDDHIVSFQKHKTEQEKELQRLKIEELKLKIKLLNGMVRAREDVARFIEQQLDWKTEASSEASCPHYGVCELHELMDYIYGGAPENSGEEICAKGKGWHR